MVVDPVAPERAQPPVGNSLGFGGLLERLPLHAIEGPTGLEFVVELAADLFDIFAGLGPFRLNIGMAEIVEDGGALNTISQSLLGTGEKKKKERKNERKTGCKRGLRNIPS